ncbi:MAG: AAA-like domain-containing protein [Acidobacteriota bacterium]
MKETLVPQGRRVRIFISYKHNPILDEPVALAIYEALKDHYDVFIDQSMHTGSNWAKRIQMELRQTDYLIALLSHQSIESEMVLGEIEEIYHLSKEQDGRPLILPVRLNYKQRLPYPLNAYLSHINALYWHSPEDTLHIIEELKRVIAGEATLNQMTLPAEPTFSYQPVDLPTPTAQLESPEGTMGPQSIFYIERPCDQIAIEKIREQGVTITIKAPRQMGKSSLLCRLIDNIVKEGSKRIIFLDFQLIDKPTRANADLFFRQFCNWITDELELENRVDEYWASPLGNSHRCTRYLGRYLLKSLDQPLVLAMDEVDSVLETSFRTDFFSMLRSWHNNRATAPIWRQLDLALVISTEPHLLIADQNQSPFNVGECIELQDFTPAQISDLNERHGSPLSATEEHQLMILLSGHPYLVRRAFYLIAKGRLSMAEMIETATADDGPFNGHLRNLLFRLQGQDDLINGFKQVISEGVCRDEKIRFRLWSAGLVHLRQGKTTPRCQLYADYFRERLNA